MIVNWKCFFSAGAHLIITNTYQASVDGFVEHLGVSPEQGYELIVRAVELAKRALNLYLEEYRGCIQDGKHAHIFFASPFFVSF